MAVFNRLRNYPVGTEIQGSSGHVRVKQEDGKWISRARVRMSKILGRDLLKTERVYHKNGHPDEDLKKNLVVLNFTGQQYRIDRSRPVFIPGYSGTSIKRK